MSFMVQRCADISATVFFSLLARRSKLAQVQWDLFLLTFRPIETDLVESEMIGQKIEINSVIIQCFTNSRSTSNDISNGKVNDNSTFVSQFQRRWKCVELQICVEFESPTFASKHFDWKFWRLRGLFKNVAKHQKRWSFFKNKNVFP